jgi:hypothetical protein
MNGGTFRRLPVIIGVAVIGGIGASAGVAQFSGHLIGTGGAINCTGTLAAGTYGNVVVPSGQTCTINSSVTVGGSVTLQSNATLNDLGAVINQNLLAGTGSNVSVGLSSGYSGTAPRIGGKIAISGAHQVSIASAQVGGGLSVTNSSGTVSIINMNIVQGGLTVTGNNGSTTVTGNQIGGKATCANNASFTGGGNVASGKNTCN